MDKSGRLKPITKSILFCDRNGLTLREHRNNSSLTLDLPTDKDGSSHPSLPYRHVQQTHSNALSDENVYIQQYV